MGTLSEREQRRAKMVMWRHAYLQATGEELIAMHREYHDEWALLQGDLWAGDLYPEETDALAAQISHCEWHIKEIERAMERRLRAGIERKGDQSAEDWQARFDAMRQRNIIAGLQLLGIPLKKQGREWKAQCPFHDDDTPSFSVNEDKGVWTCYSCHRGGDLVEFVALLYGKSKGEALTWLEKISGGITSGSFERPADAA